MRLSAILTLVSFLTACASTVSRQPPVARSGYSPIGAFAKTESQIFELINVERHRYGLRPLVYDPELDRMAKLQAEQMATFQKMAHVIPAAEFPTLMDRAQHVGYTYGRIAENVALGYPTAEAVVEGWMASKGHRENILERDVVETGVGIARSAAGGLYFCQVFGRRLTSL